MRDEKDTENQEDAKKQESAENKKIAEYESNRQEIQQKITIYNVIVTVMLPIIVTIAIQLIVKDESASAIHPLPLASPFILILVISFGLTYCKNSVAKLSAYIIVFFEKEELEWNWESRNREFSLNKPDKLIAKIFPQYACTVSMPCRFK